MNHPEVEVVAVSDEESERGRKEAAERGLEYYESLSELLADKEIAL